VVPGVVNQDVESPKYFNELCDHILNVSRFGNVRRQEDGVASVCLNSLGSLRPGGRINVHDGDSSPMSAEDLCAPFPDPFPSTGD
jgi:hypothetical protein